MDSILSLAGAVSRRRWSGILLAIVAVAGALGLRTLLEGLGQFYYLPMIPAVMITALLAHRTATALAVALSVAVNLTLVPRESLTDAATNALLFAAVSWILAEVCWAMRDVQSRARDLSRQLAAKDAMLNTALAFVPVVTLDTRGAVQNLNPAAAALFDLPEASAQGRQFALMAPGFDVTAILAAGAPGGALEARDGHWTGLRPDGASFPLSIQYGLAPDADGRPHIALCLTDLSRWHAADAQARELHAQLNKVWRLNSLGEMAATLAHELNQPLSAAATYLHASQVDMEKAGVLGDSALRTVELAKGQLLRAGKIIRRMRELLSLEARKLDSERASSMVEDLGPILTMIGSSKGVAIRLDVAAGEDQVQAERIQFQQAMVNLTRNAVEAVGDLAAPEVVIVGRPVSDTHYRISVEDNGPGIPDDQIERIFQPLTTTKSGGMGLGLSVTRTIVESHGGRLQVSRSALGGAAFSFTLNRETSVENA
ncbi:MULTISPECIES: sensor histidine kinase [unclassified Brevundimonas]|uniref:sensor histidine kinase n=1 Tax=unclassified Brevundimonas TaxID=2622653 RepID=UPI0025BB668A|nr:MULTISPECIES: ATP-binding protein [unclassified Brevundimonas]